MEQGALWALPVLLHPRSIFLGENKAMQPSRITAQNTITQSNETQSTDGVAGIGAAAPHLVDVSIAFRDFATADYSLPDLTGTPVSRLIHPRMRYVAQSTRTQSFYNVCKRAMDIAVSFTLLLLSLPLFVAIALLIKVTSRGPVFFAHRRLGLNGEEFGCLKFRTMSPDAEERLKRDGDLRRQFEEKFKLENDPRVTRVGSFLRRTSLDELPQVWQVLRGEMSLVGPRPIVRHELTKYSIYSHKLLSVRPGLSGFWQVCGRSYTTYPERVMMDIHYIDHRCFALDVQLLLLTVTAVIRKSGAW